MKGDVACIVSSGICGMVCVARYFVRFGRGLERMRDEGKVPESVVVTGFSQGGGLSLYIFAFAEKSWRGTDIWDQTGVYENSRAYSQQIQLCLRHSIRLGK